MLVKELLESKGSKVITAAEDSTVHQAVATMVENKVGSALVIDDEGNPVGIVTERDILRQVADNYSLIKEMVIRDVMSKDLIIATPDEDVNAVCQIMTDKRLRHIPVIDKGELIGIISIGDVVKASLKDSQFEIHYMRDYIMGKF